VSNNRQARRYSGLRARLAGELEGHGETALP